MSETDARLAARLAEHAGGLLLELQRTGGLSGKELGDAGDRQSNEWLLRELAAARPDDAVLSEESADSPARLSADRVWIIDPLDGTREYRMPGRPDWAVHVALWQRRARTDDDTTDDDTTGDDTPDGDTPDGTITDAAVAQPALGAVYASDDAVAVDPDPGLRFLVSDSRPPAWAAPVAAELGAELVPMGSAGAKAMAVLRGEAHGYLHDGGQWEWDSAAPVGVVRAAGLHASRIDGSPLRYNLPHPYLPDLVICRRELADDVLAAIGRALTPG